jgi:hypothetical protein
MRMMNFVIYAGHLVLLQQFILEDFDVQWMNEKCV